MGAEGLGNPVESWRQHIENDREKGLDPEMFWMRHGPEYVDATQAQELARRFPGFVKSMGQVLSGEYINSNATKPAFEAMTVDQVAEVARTVVKENPTMLKHAMSDGMSSEAAQAFVLAAKLPMVEAAAALMQLAETPQE